MAKKDATDAAATPETEKAPKKKAFKKKGEKRIVHHGFAHIQASFNNTIITITDVDGHVIRLVERRRHRLQGFAQGHAFRGDAGGDCRRQRRRRPTACAASKCA
jgi:hypothetical protein